MENTERNEAVMYDEEGFDFNVWMQGAMKHTPWWAMSIVSHALVLIIFAAIFMPEEAVKEVNAIQYTEYRPPQEIINLDERKLFQDIKIEVPPDEQPDEMKKPSDHVEADKDEAFDEDFGEKDSISSANWDSEYKNNVIGPGPGAGGPKGKGRGGDEDLFVPLTAERGKNQIPVVMNALKWLARHQSPDGSWDSDGFNNMCKGAPCAGEGYPENDIGVTGLALLAFLGCGFTHFSKDEFDGISFGKVIRNGLKYLADHQDKDGCFGPQAGKFMYNHCIAALAMAEAYGMTESKLIKEQAQAGLDFISKAQNSYRAWRYQVRPGDNDTSVTGWAVMALKSGKMAGLAIPQSSMDGAFAWIQEVTDTNYYSVGYTGKGTGKVYVKDMNENWAGHEALTAVGMMCRIFTNYNKKDPALEGGAKLLGNDLPVYNTAKQTEKPVDYYYWYYGTMALFQFDGPSAKDEKGGKYWREWNPAMQKAIGGSQKTQADGCEFGSWDSDVDRWGFEGGRVYATAINALTMEIYYRYPNAFTGGERTTK
ncbi:MAG: terpene cyclase/mutase family protein [Planctomycetes bacterium]|nr:terpene cyclase/mutase family protein [Planctomycetota bacterium]